jgi:transposase-like protein
MEADPMARKRKRYTAETKARVATEALRERKTVAQIASQYQCGTTNVSKWKQIAVKGLPKLFAAARDPGEDAKLTDSLYEQIGRLQMELAWLKKNGERFAD